MPHQGRRYPIKQEYYYWNDQWSWPTYWPKAYFLQIGHWWGPADHPPDNQVVELFSTGVQPDGITIDYEGILPDGLGHVCQFRLSYQLGELIEDSAFAIHFFRDTLQQVQKIGFPELHGSAEHLLFNVNTATHDPGAVLWFEDGLRTTARDWAATP